MTSVQQPILLLVLFFALTGCSTSNRGFLINGAGSLLSWDLDETVQKNSENTFDLPFGGPVFSVTVFSAPTHGEVTLALNAGQFTYRPDQNYVGSDLIILTARDAAGRSASSEVTLQVVEETAGPNGPGGTGPENGASTRHRVFLSSLSFTANLGGIAGADSICQGLAANAGLAGQWKAVLSDSTVQAKNRIAITKPVEDMQGRLLADNASDMWDGQLDYAIQFDEYGMYRGTSIVWTGTDADGTRDGGPYTTFCGNWTLTSGGVEAGRTDHADYRWLGIYAEGDQSAHACSNTSRLYCISN